MNAKVRQLSVAPGEVIVQLEDGRMFALSGKNVNEAEWVRLPDFPESDAAKARRELEARAVASGMVLP